MAHLPIDDAESLYTGNPQHSWNGLSKELTERKGKAEGISDNLVGMMMPIVQRMDQMHRPYPSSPEELDNMLNNELSKFK